MRYDGLRKLARNKQLIKFHKANPGLSYKEIGGVFGITAARVHQILKATQSPKSAKEEK